MKLVRLLPLVCLGLLACAEEEPIVAAPIDPEIESAEAAERAAERALTDPAVERTLASVRFQARRQLRFGEKPEWVSGADLDGDGHAELIVASLAPGRLHVFPNEGGGLASQPRTLPIAGYPLRPEPFDLTDGRRGVVVVARADRTVSLWDPFGETPARPRCAVQLEVTPRAFALGDLGADGSIEVVVVGDRGRLDVVALTSTSARIVSSSEVPNQLPRCLHVTSDGKTVLIGYQATRSLFSFPIDASGTLGTPTEIALGGMPRGLAEVDLDGDGRTELALAGGDDQLWLFGRGVEPGSIESAATERWFAAAPEVLRAGSIPIDISPRPAGIDVLAYGGLSLSSWKAESTEVRLQEEVHAGQTPRSLAALDIDGDGVRDVALANRDSHAVSLVLGSADGGLEQDRRTAVGEFPDGVVIADVDHDGDPDVISLDTNDGTLSLCLNEEGTLGPRSVIPVGSGPRGLRVVDLDRDGAADLALVIQRDVGAQLVRLFGDGRGGFERRSEVVDLDIGLAASDLWVQDLDGDGALEFVVVDDESGLVAILSSSSADEMALAKTLEVTVSAGPTAIVAVEVDGDPQPELALALGGAGERRGVLIAELAAGGWSELAFTELAHGPIDLVAVDLDGDGTTELATLAPLGPDGSPGEVVPFLLQPATGGRACALHALEPRTTDLAPRQLAAADADGDGAAEVVVCAQFSHIVDLWRARGAGSKLSLERDADLGAGIGPMAAAFGDIDGNGRLDLVVVNGHSGDVSVLFVR